MKKGITDPHPGSQAFLKTFHIHTTIHKAKIQAPIPASLLNISDKEGNCSNAKLNSGIFNLLKNKKSEYKTTNKI